VTFRGIPAIQNPVDLNVISILGWKSLSDVHYEMEELGDLHYGMEASLQKR
jgi:hypothetical protein